MAIADENEILGYLTSIMRREDEEIKFSDSFKACELLGKYYGIFESKRPESSVGDVIIVDNINGKRRKKT